MSGINPISKYQMDTMVWHGDKPSSPVEGSCYFDTSSDMGYVYISGKWVIFSSDNAPPKSLIPTDAQLEKHPALKESWEEYLVIKKLLGL
jgi:hypothetical protein